MSFGGGFDRRGLGRPIVEAQQHLLGRGVGDQDTVAASKFRADRDQLTGLRLSKLTPPIGDSEFSCVELGQTYRGTLAVKLPANPNFRVVEARIADDAGQPILTLSTVMRK